jgi:hypothetical protein
MAQLVDRLVMMPQQMLDDSCLSCKNCFVKRQPLDFILFLLNGTFARNLFYLLGLGARADGAVFS